jgi:hypothetical protein
MNPVVTVCCGCKDDLGGLGDLEDAIPQLVAVVLAAFRGGGHEHWGCHAGRIHLTLLVTLGGGAPARACATAQRPDLE